MEQLGARRLTAITKCDDQVHAQHGTSHNRQRALTTTRRQLRRTQDADGWRTKMAEAQRAVLLALGIEPARLAEADAAASAAAAQVPLSRSALAFPMCMCFFVSYSQTFNQYSCSGGVACR